ncbi:MAG: HAMP domain-containing histidine kinase, partial [Sphingobacteriaceae bacterium]
TEQKQREQYKDDFISIASHELKTPITSLKASLQMLNRLKSKIEPAIVPKLIEQANKSMEKTSTLVEDLLNASKVNAGQLHLNKNTFNAAQMLQNSCEHVKAVGKHRLIFLGDPQLQVYADEHRIDQIIVNMVNNAVKYAPESKNIFLIAEKAGAYTKISVKDNGPGIAADKTPHLFERYYRSDYQGVQFSGIGLGLYISAEIVRKHGGEIGVQSEPGKGSTFWFTLPAAETV